MNSKILIFNLVIVFFGFWGYGLNFYKLVNLDFESPYKAEVIRVIGVFPPIGAIAGWFDIEDGDKSNEK